MKIHYPEELPISSHRTELIDAIRNNDVVIVAGETGSGKSTQIPKMIVEALGNGAIIACTQPRRLAAVSIAARVAEECEVDLGTAIGYRIRFDDTTYSGTKITVCTDGILLQEVKFDLLLSKYDVVFVDEAHERSLRIDFLLGLLKDIQRKRKTQNLNPLTIIIASATLDTEKFVNFFSFDKEQRDFDKEQRDFDKKQREFDKKPRNFGKKRGKNRSMNNMEKTETYAIENSRIKSHQIEANQVETQHSYNEIKVANFSVGGRMFPVEIIYSPLENNENLSFKIAQLVKEIHVSKQHGDVLIFLPGVQEIIATIKAVQVFGYSDLRCLPLFSTLSMEEQQAIFALHPNVRHVVVATNIAETSLTVPGIVTVIDSGLARMTGFDTVTGIGSLTVQKISQASAIQRSGRAGRIEPGICYRLYSQEDFEHRESFTKPEIQRSDLSEVVLQMILMGIPDIHTFEFMDPPRPDFFEQAIDTLHTLGALDDEENLTEIGYKMAHLPLDPKISRMLLTAEEYDCVAEVAVISSFLSLKDPFIRPIDEEEQADKSKAYFQRLGMVRPVILSKPYFNGRRMIYKKKTSFYGKDRPYHSDLLTYLALWKKVLSLPEAEREIYCVRHYIDFQTIERAREIYEQLTETLLQFYSEEFEPYQQKLQAMLEPESPDKGLNINTIGIIKSIATGFIQNLCQRNRFGNYTSVKVDRITIHPGSLFFNRRPQCFVATEIIETTKLFARNITEVDPSWFGGARYKSKKPSQKSRKFKKQRKDRRKNYKKRKR